MTMYLSWKCVIVLVILGCASELWAAPVKHREAVVADAAKDDKRNGEVKVENHAESVLTPKLSLHLFIAFGLIATVILTIVSILKKVWEKYSDWKDRKDSLKRQEVSFDDVFVTKKLFKPNKGKKVFTPPRNIFDDV